MSGSGTAFALNGGPIDIALARNPGTFSADFATANNDLAIDSSLRSAVVLSLACDRVAAPDDVLPFPTAPGVLPDRRGWWADAPSDGSDPTSQSLSGSRLWLLARAIATTGTALSAQQYCTEALAWLTAAPAAGGAPIATSVTVATAWEAPDRLAINVVIARATPGGGTVNHAYDLYWQAS